MSSDPQRQPFPKNFTAHIVNILKEIKMNASGTMRKITGMANGSAGSQDAATVKQMEDYVISAIGDNVAKRPVHAATTVALPANTRTGDVLKADAVGAFPTIDGVAAALNNEYLVKNEGGVAAHINNGIYELTVLGDGATEWELTRRDDMEGGESASGAMVPITDGTVGADTTFKCINNIGSDVINTDALEFWFWGQTTDHANLKNLNWSVAGHVLDKFISIYFCDETNGDDTNGDGTSLYPYKTYQKAIDVGGTNIYIIGDPQLADQAITIPAGKLVSIFILRGVDSIIGKYLTTVTLNNASKFVGKGTDVHTFVQAGGISTASVFMENGEITAVPTVPLPQITFEFHGTTMHENTWAYIKANSASLSGNANTRDRFISSKGFDANGEDIINVKDPTAAQHADTQNARDAAIATHAGLPSVHHTKYTDSEAQAAVKYQADVNLAGVAPVDADVAGWTAGDRGMGIGTGSRLFFMYKQGTAVKYVELS